MNRLWLFFLLVFLNKGELFGQHNVALLDAPIRGLQQVRLDKNGPETFPFTLDRGLIYVEAQLEGNKGMYILDTGAPGLVVNEIPEAPSATYHGRSCAGEITVGSRFIKHFVWGEREWGRLEVTMLDLQHLRLRHDKPIQGLLGYELLQGLSLLIDYQQQKISVLDHSVNAALHQPAYRLPFVLEGHLPIIEVQVGAHTLRLGIDTGSASNILASDWWGILQDHGKLLHREQLRGLDQKIHLVEAVEMSNLRYAEGVIDTKFLLLDLSHLQVDYAPSLDGLLGHDFLSRFTIAIDYANAEILFWPVE